MTNEQKIWSFLLEKIGNPYGVAGLMGNLYAESGLRANNLQNSYEKSLGMTDESYTAAVDNGSYTNFVKDCAGYGLAQWTYWSRKQALLDFVKAVGASIGDMDTQLAFLWEELSEGYKSSVLAVLKSAKSVKEASDAVLTKFERPADQSDTAKSRRAGYGQKYYDKYAEGEINMSNSPLVDYVKISPHKNSPRKSKIKKITIHHMAGNLSVETCGNVFNGTREASSNYGIGSDGRVGMYVEEKDRAWTSGNADNDNQAVTIEVANDVCKDDWHVSNTALAKLIDLCVDICKRNGIDRLNYTGDKTGNLTMHKWFAATSCPGPYLESKFPYIAEEVNKRLSGAEESYTPPKTETKKTVDELAKEVLNGAWGNGDERKQRLTAAGYDYNAVQNKVNELCNSSGKTETKPAPAGDGYTVYIVVKGDTLSGIAAKYGTTYQKLAEYNGISNPNIISIGQKIKIPGASAPAPEKWVPAVGDIVNFKDTKHYSNAGAVTGPVCRPGKAKITAIYKPGVARHPYHLVAVKGGGSTVYGWVSEGTFTKA